MWCQITASSLLRHMRSGLLRVRCFSAVGASTRRHGMRMGFAMRQQAISAIFAKALRLNSSSIADVSAGKVNNRHPPQ